MIPTKIKNQLNVTKVICNTSLVDLDNEQWKTIEGFENYAISNYGRVKSLERNYTFFKGLEKFQPEVIMKQIFVKQHNKYLNSNSYSMHVTLSLNSKKYRKSVARLVYYHFVEKFEISNRNNIITFKDDNSLNIHVTNLEKVSASEHRLRTYRKDRARNSRVHYLKPVSQYTVQGDLVHQYESIYEAQKTVGVGCESILDAINKKSLTSGGFRWFLQSSPPKKEDFIVAPKSKSSEKDFNKLLWEKLGKPLVNFDNPPGCLNLSLKDIIGEEWKPIPNFEGYFAVSNKGRIKHLSGWTSNGRKIFLQDKILCQTLSFKNKIPNSLYTTLLHSGKITRITTTRLMYYCFVEKFDIYDKTNIVINQNEFLWDIDISKLYLRPNNKKKVKKSKINRTYSRVREIE